MPSYSRAGAGGGGGGAGATGSSSGTRSLSMRELMDMPFDQLAGSVAAAVPSVRALHVVGGGGGSSILSAGLGPEGPGMRPLLPPVARGRSSSAARRRDPDPDMDVALWLTDLSPSSASRRPFRPPRPDLPLVLALALGDMGPVVGGDAGWHGHGHGHGQGQGPARRSSGVRRHGGGMVLDPEGSFLGPGGSSSLRPYTSGAASEGGRSSLPYDYEQLLMLDEGRVRRAVRPEVIRALPTRTARSADASQQCNVCLERFTPSRTAITALPCSHAFCSDCIRPWLAANATCPVCRWEFPSQHTHLVAAAEGGA